MKNYLIADLPLRLQCFGPTLNHLARTYQAGTGPEAAITIISAQVDAIAIQGREVRREKNSIYTRDAAFDHIYYQENGRIKQHSASNPEATAFSFEFCDRLTAYPDLSLDEWEYIQTGLAFSRALLNYDGFCLHAAAVALDNRAILFSAPCGTGKSTHAGLWQERFGPERAVIINDDKPALRRLDNKFYVYGTPWSGKSGLNINVRAPLAAVVFLKQAPENRLKRLNSREAIPWLLGQCLRPGGDREKMDKLLTLLDALLQETPMYQLDCTISPAAADLVHAAIFDEGTG